MLKWHVLPRLCISLEAHEFQYGSLWIAGCFKKSTAFPQWEWVAAAEGLVRASFTRGSRSPDSARVPRPAFRSAVGRRRQHQSARRALARVRRPAGPQGRALRLPPAGGGHGGQAVPGFGGGRAREATSRHPATKTSLDQSRGPTAPELNPLLRFRRRPQRFKARIAKQARRRGEASGKRRVNRGGATDRGTTFCRLRGWPAKLCGSSYWLCGAHAACPLAER